MTRIEWVKNPDGTNGLTWNPVIGCRRGCNFCYAKKMNQRFGFIKNWQEPEWVEKNYQKRFPNKPSLIFVGSMSDIAYWHKNWIEQVKFRTRCHSEHKFLFLTKDETTYTKFSDYAPNCFFGVTLTSMRKLNYNPYFVSIEPMQSRFETIPMVKWIIVGKETGLRVGKIEPKKSWIEEMVKTCKAFGIPLFMKNSLKDIWGKKLIQQFPKFGA